MPKDTLNNQDIDNDSVISSDESDDDDLTDPHDWESEASEFGSEDGKPDVDWLWLHTDLICRHDIKFCMVFDLTASKSD